MQNCREQKQLECTWKGRLKRGWSLQLPAAIPTFKRVFNLGMAIGQREITQACKVYDGDLRSGVPAAQAPLTGSGVVRTPCRRAGPRPKVFVSNELTLKLYLEGTPLDSYGRTSTMGRTPDVIISTCHLAYGHVCIP